MTAMAEATSPRQQIQWLLMPLLLPDYLLINGSIDVCT
jgi:hypothetical protein